MLLLLLLLLFLLLLLLFWLLLLLVVALVLGPPNAPASCAGAAVGGSFHSGASAGRGGLEAETPLPVALQQLFYRLSHAKQTVQLPACICPVLLAPPAGVLASAVS